MNIPSDDEARLVLVVAVAMPAPGLLSGHRFGLGAGAACLMLLAGLLAYHHRASARQARNHIRSEKAIYHAIARLPQAAGDFRPAVGAILDRVEEVYGPWAAAITLLHTGNPRDRGNPSIRVALPGNRELSRKPSSSFIIVVVLCRT